MTVLSTVKLKTYRVNRVLRIGLENIEGKIYRNVVTTYSPTIRVPIAGVVAGYIC